MQSAAVVIAIARHVKPSFEAAFKEALRAGILPASTYPGYEEGEVLYLETKRGEWQPILRLDAQVDLQEWEEYPICQGLIIRAEALTISAARVLRVNRLAAWFALPEVPNALQTPEQTPLLCKRY
jgi:antibiotic biosynthesis monooxygenase (ABM) superfamily enzyme